MKVTWKQADDPHRLRELVDRERAAKQRDRYRVVLLAGEGDKGVELTREQIAQRVDRSRQFVDEWVKRYRRGGLAALVPRRQPGARPKLTSEQQEQLKAMLEAGPSPQEPIAAYNGPVLRQKIQERFGQLYALSGVYALLHRLGYNDLMPRTTHPDTDLQEQEQFKKKSCPSALRKSKRPTPPSGS